MKKAKININVFPKFIPFNNKTIHNRVNIDITIVSIWGKISVNIDPEVEANKNEHEYRR